MNAVQDIYCECDGESCTSAEKCYCSLRGHPAEDHSPKRPSVLPEKGRVEGTRLHVPHSLSQPHPPPPPPPPMMRSKNNTTIIHCNGSSTMSSTCSSCICGSGDDSGSTATDTTCYSIHRTTSYAPLNNNNNHHDNSLLSGFESPQTAWRRNSRLAAPEQCYNCSECGRAGGRTAAEPDSGGSGYASNDSCPLHGGGGGGGARRPPVALQHRSRSHDVASHVSSSHSSGCASCGGGGGGRGRQQQQHLNGKVLVLSGVDKAGKVSGSRMDGGDSFPQLRFLGQQNHRPRAISRPVEHVRPSVTLFLWFSHRRFSKPMAVQVSSLCTV